MYLMENIKKRGRVMNKNLMMFLVLLIGWIFTFIVSYFVKGQFYDFMYNANIWVILGLLVSIAMTYKKSS